MPHAGYSSLGAVLRYAPSERYVIEHAWYFAVSSVYNRGIPLSIKVSFIVNMIRDVILLFFIFTFLPFFISFFISLYEYEYGTVRYGRFHTVAL